MWTKLGTQIVALLLLKNAADATTAERIPTSLFGHDLEFTRHDLWEGLSAEMIANHKFALPSSPLSQWPIEIQKLAEEGIVPRWTAVGNARLDAPAWAPYGSMLTGDVGHSIRCDSVAKDEECGVEQGSFLGGFDSGMSFGSSISVEAGAAYALRLVLNGTEGTTVTASLTDETNDPSTLIWSSTFFPSSTTWETFEGNITIGSRGSSNVTLRISTIGPSRSFNLGSVSMSRRDRTWRGMRVDAIDALRTIGFKGLLRWPGGCFAPFYRWKIGLLERGFRPPIETPPEYCAAVKGGVNAYSDGMMENGIGVDDYMALCERLGMEPAVTLRLQYGTKEEIDEAVDLIEYLNGDANTTTWGQLRAKRGRVQPYNVRNFYLGNEIAQQARYRAYPNVATGDAPPNATEYALILNKTIPPILSASPLLPLRLMAVSAPGPGAKTWNAAWASVVGPHIFATSLHDGYYPEPSVWTSENVNDCVQRPGREFVPALRSMRRDLDAIPSDVAANVGISADEWGLGPPWLVKKFGVPHAIYAASFLASCMRVAAETKLVFTNYFEPINEGAVDVRSTDIASLTPVGQVMRVYAQHARGLLADGIESSASPSIIDVLATEHDDDGEGESLFVTLAGLDATRWNSSSAVVVVSLPDEWKVASSAVASTLRAYGYGPNSTFASAAQSNITISSNGEMSVVVPPLSVVGVRIR